MIAPLLARNCLRPATATAASAVFPAASTLPIVAHRSLSSTSTAMSSSSGTFTASQHKPPILAELKSPIFATLHEAKGKKGLTFEQVAKGIGRNELYTAAIFYGQAKPDKADVEALSKLLDIRHEYLIEALGPDYFPYRGLGEWPPKDPVLYRLHEAVMVYGYPIKHIVHEKMQKDGIISAIDFTGDVERISDPKGDRIRMTLEGKFLEYKRW
ncbi:Cyanase [Microstroma glucosiphilum]|uniref:Cyanate hydratase n=1 Tax=Pseudomicrostroma glucosiphilum TaxID=1684307 RepID=A0A316U9J5_9BASI|nr:Cyanase [Pseudomicrostroma glucosiphilum]PWN21508.1 Cyanase [Pseudomicrostroma glucosiphilum]